jgi:hypothetical protein
LISDERFNNYVEAAEMRTQNLEIHLEKLWDVTMEMRGLLKAHLNETRGGECNTVPNPFKGKVIYVAGPFTGDLETNVAQAKEVAWQLYQKGHCPIVPHTNFDFAPPTMDEWRGVIRICMAILHRVDAIYMLPGWKDSVGAVTEWYVAHALYRTVYYNLGDVPDAK